MRKIILITGLLLGFYLGEELAHAACQFITIMQDGQVKSCTVCKYGNQTIVTCS